MATTTRIAPITVKATRDKKGGGKNWLKFDTPAESGVMAVYIDARKLGLDKEADKGSLPGSVTVTVKFGR